VLSQDDNENASVINTQPKKDYMNTPTVLITGALTGIGRATALAFGREGARVVVSGRRDDHPFRTLANLLATPHIGFVSRGLYTRFYQDTVENIRRWLDGQAIGG
jgi:NAD(P)-dependent dehydrogenase (short-subunit alcohol dehydrogenase family)